MRVLLCLNPEGLLIEKPSANKQANRDDDDDGACYVDVGIRVSHHPSPRLALSLLSLKSRCVNLGRCILLYSSAW